MYFPYPDKSTPSLQGVGSYHKSQDFTPIQAIDGLGAYHAAKTSVPVPAIGGLGQDPAGYAPIRAPWFVQGTPYPYIKGPNYTRPVFREHSREGNFKAYPIVKMPPLEGLGEGEAIPQATPETVCSVVKEIPDAHERCMTFNTKMMNAGPAKLTEMQASIAAADSACSDIQEFAEWGECYYSHLESAWYENPAYLGAAIVGGCAVAGMAILAFRRTAG